MPSASCLIQVNGGGFGPTTNGTDAPASAAIDFKLASSVGVSQWIVRVVGADELTTYPVLVGANPGTGIVTPVTATISFAMPAAPLGRTVVVESLIQVGPLFYRDRFSVYVLSAFGTRVPAAGESTESSVLYGWAPHVNPILRDGSVRIFYDDTLAAPALGTDNVQGAIDALKAGVGSTLVGDVSGPTTSNIVDKIKNATVPTVGGADLGKVLTVVGTASGGTLAYQTPGASAGASVKQTYICPGTVNVFDVVALSASDTVDKANAANPALSPALGIVISKPTATSAEVMHYGSIPGMVGLTPGSTYFLSSSSGSMSTIPPTGSGVIVQTLGVATSPTTFLAMVTREFVLLALPSHGQVSLRR